MIEPDFWKTKKLNKLSTQEWEALCDGCGKCCLDKLINTKTKKVYYTDVACSLFDIDKCICRFYDTRHSANPKCVPIRLKDKKVFTFLPLTCSYRLLYEGKNLPDWHYLVCGDHKAVHRRGFSIKKKAIHPYDKMIIEDHIIFEL